MILVRRANRHVANPVLGPFAQRLPGFAVLLHVGRRSGRQYRTPVNLFVAADGRRYLVQRIIGEAEHAGAVRPGPGPGGRRVRRGRR